MLRPDADPGTPHVPLVRAVHLNSYLGVLREVGEPVDRAIERARLPWNIEETPDAYLVVPRVVACASACGGAEAAMELGFIGAQTLTLEDLRPECRLAILNAPSGYLRVEAMLRLISLEDGALRSCVVEASEGLRICCDLAGFADSPALAYSEWLQIFGFVAAVRSIAGEDWCPDEITFVAHGEVPDAARAAFPNTRFLTGQRHCSIVAPREVLAAPCPEAGIMAADCGPAEDAPGTGGWDFVTSLREMIKPYLGLKPPMLGDVAEVVGISPRSLQRRLERAGVSYRKVVADARYQIACELLRDPARKIIDVAFEAGYENPQHFARAFRKTAGITPRAYRNAQEPTG